MAVRTNNTSQNVTSNFWKKFGEVVGVAASIIAILGIGFAVGVYVTNTQYENKITNINIENQSKLNDEREKGRKEGIAEMQQREEQMRNYLILFRNNDQKNDQKH